MGKFPWKKEWLHTPVFLPGEFHGQRSLVGLHSMGSQRLRYNWERFTHMHTHTHTRTHTLTQVRARAHTHTHTHGARNDRDNVVTFTILTTRGQQEAMLLKPLTASVAITSIYSHIYGNLGEYVSTFYSNILIFLPEINGIPQEWGCDLGHVTDMPISRAVEGIIVSWSCPRESLYAGWLITEKYSLTVLEARSPKSRHQHGRAPSKGSGGKSLSLPAPGESGLSHSTLCPCLLVGFLTCLSLGLL